MEKNKNAKRGLALMMAFVMMLSIVIISPTTVTAAKKTEIDPYFKEIKLSFNSHGDSTYMTSSFVGLETLILNPKKKATYSIKIKNTKIAKAVKNKRDLVEFKTLICAKKTGTTTGDVYETVGKKSKKLGTVKIKVSKMKMADVVDETAFGNDALMDFEYFLAPYMGKNKINLANEIQKVLLNNKERGIHFKKSDYKVTYGVEHLSDENNNPIEAVSLNKSGIITAKTEGESLVTFDLKFTDGSKTQGSICAKVLNSSIVKEGKYNLSNIREYIKGLDTEVELKDGSKTVLTCFDNASTTPAFKPVEEEVSKELEMYGSIGRGFSQKSNHSTELYQNTRSKVLDFVSADPTKYNCFYVNSTTDGLNKLASALITSKDDIVLTTRIEHHANDLSWRERCKVIYAEVDKQGRVKYSDIEKLLKKNKVKIVSVTAASNVTGYVTDVHKVAKLAHKYGAMCVVDGAQIVAHRKFSMIGNVNDPNDDIDFLAFSAHKMYSPYGGGAVVGIKKELYKHMPTFYGGGTVQIVADDWVDYKEKDIAVYEAGSPNYPGVVGLGKAIDVLSDVGFDSIQAHEKALNRRLIDGLKKFKNVIIYGDSENIDDRVGVVTFNFSDVNSQFLAVSLSDLGAVATRRGAFCAHPYVWRLMGIPDSELKSFEGCADAKTPGMIRVSFGIYNTEEEVDRLLELLPKAIEDAKAKQENMDTIPEY